MGELRIFGQQLSFAQIRVPLMQGLPPQVLGSIEMRCSKGFIAVWSFSEETRPAASGGAERMAAGRRTGIITRMTYAVRPVTSFDRGAAYSPWRATRNWRCLSDCSVAAFRAEFNTTPISRNRSSQPLARQR